MLGLLPLADARLWVVPFLYLAVLLAAATIDAAGLPARGCSAERQMLRPLPLGVRQPVRLRLRWSEAAGMPAEVADHAPHQLAPAPRAVGGAFDAAGLLQVAYEVQPPRRGPYRFGPVDVRVGRRRGLWQRQVRVDVEETVRVYPNVLPIREYELSLRRGMRFMPGLRRTRPPGATTAFAGLRDYLPGDDVRRISWSASARMDKPVSVMLEAERGQQLLVAIDCGRLMTAPVGAMTKLDHAVNAALLVAWVAHSQGDRVGLATFSDGLRQYLPPQRGAQQISRLNETLYAVQAEYLEPDFGQAFAQIGGLVNRRTLVLVLTDVLDPEASSDLVSHALRLGGRHLVMVVAMSDPEVLAARSRPLETADRVYEWAAAEELLAARRRSFELLRQGGVLGLDVAAGELSPRLVERYLELKERALL